MLGQQQRYVSVYEGIASCSLLPDQLRRPFEEKKSLVQSTLIKFCIGDLGKRMARSIEARIETQRSRALSLSIDTRRIFFTASWLISTVIGAKIKV